MFSPDDLQEQRFTRPTPYQQPAAAPETGRGRDTSLPTQKPAQRATGEYQRNYQGDMAGIGDDSGMRLPPSERDRKNLGRFTGSSGIKELSELRRYPQDAKKPSAIVRHSSIVRWNHVADRLFALLVLALSFLGNVGGYDGGFVAAKETDEHFFVWRMPTPAAWIAGFVSLVCLSYIQYRFSPMHDMSYTDNHRQRVKLHGLERFYRVLQQTTWQWSAAVIYGSYLTVIAFKPIVYPIVLSASESSGLFSVGLTPVVAWIVYGYIAFAVEASPEDILVSED